MQYQLTLDDKKINELVTLTKASNVGEVTREALAIYEWMVNETLKGRTIISCDSSGNNPARVDTDLIKKVRSRIN